MRLLKYPRRYLFLAKKKARHSLPGNDTGISLADLI